MKSVVLILVCLAASVFGDYDRTTECLNGVSPGNCGAFGQKCPTLCHSGYSMSCSWRMSSGVYSFADNLCSCMCSGTEPDTTTQQPTTQSPSTDESTTASTTTTTSTTTTASSSDSEDFTDFQNTILQKHNEYRAKHQNTSSLQLSATLNTYAQKLAENNREIGHLQHSSGSYGENLYYGSGWQTAPTGEASVAAFYDEIANYNFATHSSNGGVIGHFTQLVWKSSTHLGVGRAYDGNKVFVACVYNPAGNYVGQYAQNIMPEI